MNLVTWVPGQPNTNGKTNTLSLIDLVYISLRPTQQAAGSVLHRSLYKNDKEQQDHLVNIDLINIHLISIDLARIDLIDIDLVNIDLVNIDLVKTCELMVLIELITHMDHP